MEIKVRNLLLILGVLMLLGCASAYKPINHSQNLNTKLEDENLVFKYSYDVLRNAGNKKYSKKETNNHIKVIAVSIKNKTNKEILVSENIDFYAGNMKVSILSPNEYSHSLKQNTVSYLFYLLLTPLKLIIASTNNDPDVIPIGYVLGPGITLLNIISSSSANAKFDDELTKNNILGKIIEPGEVLNGLIAIRGIGYEPLSIQLRKE